MRISLHIRTGKHTGRVVAIPGPRFIIGSGDNCHLKLNANQASNYHCALLVQDDGIWVRDYGGGTIVNGVRVFDRCRLENADRLEIGTIQFEVQIEGAPLGGNDRVPEQPRSVDFLAQREHPAALAPELSDAIGARSKLPTVAALVLAPPPNQAEPATARPSDIGNARSESPIVSTVAVAAAFKQAEPTATAGLNDNDLLVTRTKPTTAPTPAAAAKQAEPTYTVGPSDNDLIIARTEPPTVSAVAAPARQPEPAATAALSDVSNPRSESPRVARPWYAAPSKEEPADVVADTMLKRFFVRKNAFNDQNAPAPVAKPKSMGLPWWMKIFPADGLDPNVMFILGILVGIGLSAAGFAFFTISRGG